VERALAAHPRIRAARDRDSGDGLKVHFQRLKTPATAAKSAKNVVKLCGCGFMRLLQMTDCLASR
jgi:hypothetical protein